MQHVTLTGRDHLLPWIDRASKSATASNTTQRNHQLFYRLQNVKDVSVLGIECFKDWRGR